MTPGRRLGWVGLSPRLVSAELALGALGTEHRQVVVDVDVAAPFVNQRATGGDRLEEHAEAIVQCFLASAREGDWRAADALITRVYGKPQEKLEVSRPDEFDLTKLSMEELHEMRNRILAEHPELAELTGRAMPSAVKI